MYKNFIRSKFRLLLAFILVLVFAFPAMAEVKVTSGKMGVHGQLGTEKQPWAEFWLGGSCLHQDTVELTNAEIKALRATPKVLVAAPGSGKFIEVKSVVLILDYGSNALTESADNLVVEYGTSNDDISAAIEMTGFIDQTADTIMSAVMLSQAANAATDMVNNTVELFNTGDGEIAGNAGLDTTLTVKISYVIHASGL